MDAFDPFSTTPHDGAPFPSRDGTAPEDATSEAQTWALRALEAPTPKEARAWAERALALDPTNLDARHAAILHRGQTPEATIEALTALAVEAEQALGAAFIESERGRLWNHERARPYLRARLSLALLLERSGKAKEALPHFEALVRFSQGDPQGASLHLARCLASLGRFRALRHVLDTHPCQDAVAWAWLRVLERHHLGTEAQARDALAAARRLNPHVEAFLTARDKAPRVQPERPQPGSREEAARVFRLLSSAWTPHRDALTWLMRQP